MARTPPLLVGLLIALLAGPVPGAEAQPGFDRLLGPDEFGNPIVMRAVNGRTLNAFARAAAVPMGVELAPAESGRQQSPVTLTGVSIGRALQLIADFDQRYEMRESDGVFVLRPREAWGRPGHPLHAAVPPVLLPNIRGRNALSLIAALLDAPQYRDISLEDTRRFSLNLKAGTVLDLLNATVRAYGDMAWWFETAGPAKGSVFPYTVGLAGYGCGVPGLVPRHPVDVALYADPVLLSLNGSPAVLDRIVGNAPHGGPLIVHGPYPQEIYALATAARVPMGIESLGGSILPLWSNIPATGRTLPEVLDAIIAVDPRYEWREMQGVIVIRPAAAWNDPHNPLFTLVPAVQLIDVSPGEAIERFAQALEHTGPVAFPQGNPMSIPQGHPMSVDQPQGTMLDLANAMVREHGQMTWALAPSMNPPSIEQSYQYIFRFLVMSGRGFPVDVR